MGIARKLFLAFLAVFTTYVLVFHGLTEAWATLVFTGIAYLVLECVQSLFRAILRLFDGQPRVEYHIHIQDVRRDPTAPGYEDIEMVQINGVWRRR